MNHLVAHGCGHDALERGHALAAAAGEVLIGKIQQLAARGGGHFGDGGAYLAVKAQHGAIDLNGMLQPLFDQHAAIVGEGQLQRLAQPLTVVGAADTDGGTQARGLAENRIGQRLLHTGDNGLGRGAPLAAQGEYIGQDGIAHAAEYLLHHDLIHADGRARHARGGIGDIGQLQQAL